MATALKPGTLVLLSANPIHDTGGGQRSAQLALEFLERGWTVAFVAAGEVTETVDLQLRFDHPRLVEVTEAEFRTPARSTRRLRRWLAGLPAPDGAGAGGGPLVLLVQPPLAGWDRIVRRFRLAGGRTVYDCIDLWDSELGWGWYGRRAERRIARAVDLRVASAPVLEAHVRDLAGGAPVRALPNAFNARIFDPESRPERPVDLPEGRPVVLYVGALWGGWMDWPLVDRLARARPDLAFVFVGDHRDERAGRPGNCHFLGLKPQVELPGYLKHAAVGLLPWTDDPVTRATSPLKVYEYLAMGLPVLGPEIEPLRGLPDTTLARGPDDFLASLEVLAPAPEGTDAARATDRAGGPSRTPETARRRGSPEVEIREFAARNSWAARVDRLEEWLAPESGSLDGPATPRWYDRAGPLLPLLPG